MHAISSYRGNRPIDTHPQTLTHSLLRLTSEGRNDLHNERSCADDHKGCTRDPLPPVISRSSLVGQVGLLPVGGRASALREVDTVLEDVVGWHIWW